MNRTKTNIKITLKSDLCVSSGQAYSGIIDTDICMNENGFPYIPARRIKGVMRESAMMLGCEDAKIEKLFGCGGNGFEDTSIYVDDAFISDISGLDKEISRIKKAGEKTCLTEDNILALYSTVKAQTKIDDKTGVADDTSLRFTRVVNQYSPKCIDEDQNELEFIAPIEYDSDSEDIVEKIVKSVRHIGMNRNRGLGNVRCELDNKKTTIELGKEDLNVNGESDKYVEIKYKLTNVGPLVLSSSKDDVTDNYISGRVMLGALAGLYLKLKGLGDPDETFIDIFLSGNSIFSNLYITDESNNEYIPAPLYINRLKKTKKYVCVLKKPETDDWEYSPEDGNVPKKIAGKYIHMNKDNTISVMEPTVGLIYHHSQNSTYDLGRMGDEAEKGILYSQEVLEKNQTFIGSIIVMEKYAQIIKKLLETSMVRIGKSKTAEYGKCEIKLISDENQFKEASKHNSIELKKDEKIIVLMESDCIIPGEYGYTTNYNSVEKYIVKYVLRNGSDEGLRLVSNNELETYMTSKVVTGYNAKINMKKNSIPAIGAGSAFEFIVQKEGNYEFNNYTGSYNSEGFGKVRVIKESDLSYAITETQLKNNNSEQKEVNELIEKITKKIYKEKILEELKLAFIQSNSDDIKITSSTVGRLTLMLNESKREEDVLLDFSKRVASIKRDKERNEIISSLQKWSVCNIILKKSQNGLYEVVKSDSLLNKSKISELNDCTEISEVIGDEAKDLWTDYLSFILLHVKYKKSSDKRSSTKDNSAKKDNKEV